MTSSGSSLQSTLIRPAPLITDNESNLFHSQLVISDFRHTLEQAQHLHPAKVGEMVRLYLDPSVVERSSQVMWQINNVPEPGCVWKKFFAIISNQ